MFYLPTIDGTFIKGNPNDLTKENNREHEKSFDFFKTLDFLQGYSIYDAGFLFQNLLNISNAEQFKPTK
jgi:hypothetical protein